MGTFRALSSKDVEEILAGFGLSGYERHAPIAAGTINTNMVVEAGGTKRFLRINEGKSQLDVEREAAIVFHLAARGVPTPAPLRTKAGVPFLVWSGAYVSLFPWVEGRVLRRPDLLPVHASEVGRALAQLHNAGADFPDQRPGRYEPDEIHRRFDRIAALTSGDPALEEAVGILGPELERLKAERLPAVPMGVIHADLFIDNVLYQPSGALAALLDFEQASWGRLAYDLAVSLLAFGFGQSDFRDDTTRAFLDGYRKERPPTPLEIDAFSAELRFAACRFAVTRITDVYLRRGQGAPGGKDFGRYLLRLRRLHERFAAGDRLLAL